MKSVRFKYIFLLIFAFLFVNLLSINVSRVYAEEEIDLSSAYRGEIRNYWALVNYGKDYIGGDYVTIFLDPEAINNEDVNYILISEIDEDGNMTSSYSKRGENGDFDFAPRFTYYLVNENYGKKPLTLFLLENLSDKPTDIIERINIDRLERVRTIEHLTSADFVVYQEVTDYTTKPYKVYVELADSSRSCEYKIKEITYTYMHKDIDQNQTLVSGKAILDTSDPSVCNRFYFTVSENSTYNLLIEDEFGFIKPDVGDDLSIEIDNFLDGVINIVATYDKSLTRNPIDVYIDVYNGAGEKYSYSDLEELYYLYNGEEVPNSDLMNLGIFKAEQNGVYTIVCKNKEGDEVSVDVNITNIDREAPIVIVSSTININSSDVEKTPYIFNPYAQVLATDNASDGDKLVITATYYHPSINYTCDADLQLTPLEYNIYEYLYGVNDVCVRYEVSDEAGNSRSVFSKIVVRDNTIPTVSVRVEKIIIEIGDRPTDEDLINMFGLVVDDNSRKFGNTDREIHIEFDLSEVDVENLETYPLYVVATDSSGNSSERINLSVVVTVKVLVIDALPNQYIVYGEDMIEILYTCNGESCYDEILPADWDKLTGELYISSGAKYSGEYTINSSLAINSRKYEIQIGTLGKFYIKKRTFKIIANSYSIDYKDQEPVLTWYMDTSVCNADLSTKYTSFEETNYSCTFVSGDDFGGGSYVYSIENGFTLYAGGIKREEGITVKYDANKNVLFYKIELGNLVVDEVNNGGRYNYYLDFYGIDFYQGNLIPGYAQFYIYPKHVEVTLHNVNKIYGEDDPLTRYDDNMQNVIKSDGKGNVQYEFTCMSYKEPIKSMCDASSNLYSLSMLQNEIQMVINREQGEYAGEYLIKGIYLNENYDVEFNEEHQSGAVPSAYLTILRRDIQISIDGANGDGKYSIFYEDALPLVTASVTSDPNISYIGLANNDYFSINDNTLLISFRDRLNYGTHPFKYLDSNGNVMDQPNGNFEEYVNGVGIYTITRDTFTILNLDDEDVLSNYNLDFVDGELEVKARLIYIKVIDGLTKIYGDSDPSFNNAYIVNKYGNNTNYLIDGSGHYVLQIINTLENTEIVDREDYEPFDKDKLVYHLKRDKDSPYFDSDDVHEGETVGSYLVSTDRFENDSNYIIKIYQDYYFEITTREILLTINSNTIEFNYDNLVPKFSYSRSNIAFTDELIGQPKVSVFSGDYRNNGMYPVEMGDIRAYSSAPIISSIDDVWYINGESTGIDFDQIDSLDISLIKVIDGNYHIIDISTNTTIDTKIAVSEVDVMWNYTFDVIIGALRVVPRNVVVIPVDGYNKEYGNLDIPLDFITRHVGTGNLEAVLDASDFEGYLDREKGEKPGRYKIVQNTLTPAHKGNGYNFNIVSFENNHYFEILKRQISIKFTGVDEDNVLTEFYGEDLISKYSSTGYTIISGSEANAPELCTDEILDGVNVCDMIYDRVIGGIVFPEGRVDVGEYQLEHNLHFVRVIHPSIDVSAYYDLSFTAPLLNIVPRIVHITPVGGQSKIYGENDGEGTCGIKYDYDYKNLVNPNDFTGCLKRNSKINANGVETTEDVGHYIIGLGDLTLNPNFVLVLNGSVTYVITPRPIIITAKVIGDTVVKSANLNVYTMTYGDDFTLGYDVGAMGVANNPSIGVVDMIVNNVSLNPEYTGYGTYYVSQGELGITNSSNYDLRFESATFVVTKKKVVIQPHSLSKIYGDSDPEVFTFDFVDPSQSDLAYTGGLSRIPGENARSYRILIGDLSFGSNYQPEIQNETDFIIHPRKVSIVANDKEKVYGGAEPVLDYQVYIEEDFPLDTPISGELKREEGEEVGYYQILQNTLAIHSPNYDVSYTAGTFLIYYVSFESIEIKSLTNNRYQTIGDESQVELYAVFNEGADPSNLHLVEWKIIKSGNINIEFEKDSNNIVMFTPSGSSGVYVVTATYLGVSDTYEIILRPNNVSDIYISLTGGQPNQTLGLETELNYYAEVHLYEQTDEELYIEWYADQNLVCQALVTSRNFCQFTPNNLGIGTHSVYAKIGAIQSNILDVIIVDNAAPKIILVDQDVVYYIEAFQNATENSTPYSEPGFSAIDDVDGDITHKVVVTGLNEEDYYRVGTYYIIYEVVDQHGHLATNYRTVIVQDTVAPTVTLNVTELSTIVLEYGQSYIEYGATARDAYDDYYGYPLNIYIDSNLNINKVGTYEIIYFAVDSNGLRGQAIRTVRIIDIIPPVITLIGDKTIYLEYKDSYKDAGAWFEDNYDGRYRIYASSITFKAEYSDEIIQVSSVDTSLLGEYTLTYYQLDSSNNPPLEIVTRTVIVDDNTPPVITLHGSNPYILRYGTEYVEPGFSVIDNYDGDITDRIDLVSVVEVIGNTLGTYYVYYNAIDTHKNIAIEVKREVIILDLVSPIIYFTNACPQYITIEALTEDYDLRCNLPGYGYTVVDDYVPDIDAIQNWVEIDGEVDNTTIGTYEIKYNVSDRSGNKAITLIRYVKVVDTTPPEIELLPNDDGDINFYVEVFSEYIEPGWITRDLYDDYHNITITVTVTNNIVINKLNTYSVIYIATDSSGNDSEPVYREITVRDTVPPVVTLIGDAELTIERGNSYAEYGATAKDNYDDVIDDIVITNAPTGKQLGDFEVSYCATDSSGNTGCTIRLVHVVDTIPPVVLGVENGKYYRAPLYIYYSPLTGTDEILTGTLNGELISSPWYVSKEDSYHLVVRDDAGNQTVVDFVIDMTPPKLYGANDGEYLNHAVTIYSDERLKNITYRVNNGGFITVDEQSVTFEEEGQYWIYATDMAGNTSGMISFVIDMTPPAYSLQGVLNGGITDTDVTLVTENDVTVSVNNKYIPTIYTFTENGYYKVTIRDLAGNDVFLQFVINKNPSVTMIKNGTSQNVTFISQNNAIGEFIAKGDPNYPKGAGFIYAKPLIDGTFEYINGTLFSDDEYNRLKNGESISYAVPSVNEDEMVVSFIVTLEELNKFTTETVEDDDDSVIIYAFVAAAMALLIGGFFYFFIFFKRKKDEEEEEEEEIIEDDEYYF